LIEQIPDICKGLKLFNESRFPTTHYWSNQPFLKRYICSHFILDRLLQSMSLLHLYPQPRSPDKKQQSTPELVIDFHHECISEFLDEDRLFQSMDSQGNVNDYNFKPNMRFMKIGFLEVNFPADTFVRRLEPIKTCKWLLDEKPDSGFGEDREKRAANFVHAISQIMRMLLSHIRNLDLGHTVNKRSLELIRCLDRLDSHDAPIHTCVVAVWLTPLPEMWWGSRFRLETITSRSQ